MRDHSTHRSTDRRAKYERTYWRRSDEPNSWWPWGLLPLLGLLLLFLFGALRTAPAIEKQVGQRADAQLTNHGIETQTLSADGQIVDITAIGDEADRTAIHNAAGMTECKTWAGNLRCPTTVNVALQQPVVEAVPPRFHDFKYALAANALMLEGEVPSLDIKNRLVNVAKQRFDTVIDSLTVSDEVATSGYENAANKALLIFERIERGQARWHQGVFTADGMATTENMGGAQELFSQPADGVNLGDFDLRELQTIATCNDRFSTLLGETMIRFRTSSAEIDASSQALLENLAATAQVCPGRIGIEGHTDSAGAEEPNQALSLARAQAVMNALTLLNVSGDRIIAAGYGESRPIATNATASGRAQNRRIAIRILESDSQESEE